MNKELRQHAIETIAIWLAEYVSPWDRIEDEARRINDNEGFTFEISRTEPNAWIRYTEYHLSTEDFIETIKQARKLVNEVPYERSYGDRPIVPDPKTGLLGEYTEEKTYD